MTEAERIQAEYARRETLAARYALVAPSNLLAVQELERLSVAALRREGYLPLSDRDVLDAGCGNGGWLARMETWGARRERLAGIDLVAERAREAADRLPGADVRAGDASALPWDDGSFDVVFHSMMLSSVLDPEVRRRVAGELARVLRPGGVVLWYDFFVRDPRNPQVVGMRKREIRRLFEGFDVRLRRATLAPPIARAVVARSWTAGALLTSARFLDGHYVGTLRKP